MSGEVRPMLVITEDTTAEELAEAAHNISALLACTRDLGERARLRAEQDQLLDAWAARMKVPH